MEVCCTRLHTLVARVLDADPRCALDTGGTSANGKHTHRTSTWILIIISGSPSGPIGAGAICPSSEMADPA